MVEHDLKQALFARLGEGFEQLFEGQVLVGLGIEGGLTVLRQQLDERQARIQLGAQHQGIDEEADQALGFQARPVGAGHADTDVALAAIAQQQALERRQQQHERCRFTGLGGLAHGRTEPGIQAQGQARGAVVLLGRTRVVGGQVEGRQFTRELRFPVGQLALAFALGQPLALPTAIVGVLQRQWRQFGHLALGRRRVQAGKLVDQDIQRPAVGDDVVHRHQQLVFLVVQADQGHPQQRTLFQIEPGTCLIFTDLPGAGFALVGGQVAEVDQLQVERGAGVDALHGLAIALVEAGAQGFVAFDQALEAAAQRRFIQFATQAQGTGNGVGAALRVQLPEEPQTVLCQRLWQFLATRQLCDGPLDCATLLLQAGDLGGKGAQGRRFEQQTQVQFDAQRFTQAGDHLGREDRVAAQQEEMVVGRDGFHLQLFTPDPADQQLQVIDQRLGDVVRGRRLAREQRVAVEAAIGQPVAAGRTLQLATGGFRQGPRIEQHHHARRFLVSLGHRLANEFDQRLGRQDLLYAAADFRRDTDAVLAVVGDGKGGDTALAHHVDFPLDGLFDVLRVEVVPAHDQHVFQAAGDEQLAFAQETQVAGAQPGPAFVLDEGLGRRLGIAPVTVGDARAGGPDFTDEIVAEHLQAARLDYKHRMFGLAGATAHDRAAIARLRAILRQCRLIETQRGNALATLATGDEQGGLGQAVGGEVALLAETTGSEFLGEALQGIEADRLGTGIRHPPAAEVEPCQGGFADPLAAQAVGEVGTTADGAAVFADRFQPAQWPTEEVRRRHQHARHAAEDRLQQAADQAHVVVQRQPADDHVVRIDVDAEAMADQHFVGDQVAVADLHALG